jgi:hypothetical protein
VRLNCVSILGQKSLICQAQIVEVVSIPRPNLPLWDQLTRPFTWGQRHSPFWKTSFQIKTKKALDNIQKVNILCNLLCTHRHIFSSIQVWRYILLKTQCRPRCKVLVNLLPKLTRPIILHFALQLHYIVTKLQNGVWSIPQLLVRWLQKKHRIM